MMNKALYFLRKQFLYVCFAIVSCYISNHLSAGVKLSTPENVSNQAQDTSLDASSDASDDPLESFNRVTFGIHQILDGLFLEPIAQIYNLVAHPFIKERVQNITSNLATPSIFINDCLQLDGTKAQNSFLRFCLNTTFGVAGLYDFAGQYADIPGHTQDFGKTLAYYHMDSGPYLFIPIIGPSTTRDFFGKIVDYALDPVNYAIRRTTRPEWVTVRTGVDGISTRTRLLPTTHQLNRDYDPYVSYKTLYMQNRNFTVHEGEDIDYDTPVPDDDDY